MTKLMLPAVLSFALTAAAAQDPASKPSEPAVEELGQILLQQKEIIEAQAKEPEALRERLSEVEALALSSHNRLQELEEKPEEPSVGEAVEQRLAELEQQFAQSPGDSPQRGGGGLVPHSRDRDNFTFAVNGGTGVGRYITDLGSLGGQDAV
jgi:uncharacterized coiled-coil protein SlyX